VAGEQRVALIDQIEHGPDDKRDEKGTPRHTIGDRATASFAPGRDVAHVPTRLR
jgi:hypothetical protein